MASQTFLPALVLAAATGAFAQGGAAVITLDMPPPGGEGLSALQTGGAFPAGAATTYYNPALLVELERATGSQAHVTHASWDVLPGLGLEGLEQSFTAGAVSIPLPAGLDLGVGVFRNHIDFGPSLGGTGDTVESHETVLGLGAGARVLGPFSAGVAAKHYESVFGTASASGWAFDAGASYYQPMQPFSPFGVRSLELVSAAGVTWTNVGRSVRYADSGGTDPLPEALRYSLGWGLDLADVVKASWSWEWKQDTHRRASSGDPAQLVYARQVSLLGFGLGWARLVDPAGGRYETHRSREFAFDLLSAYRVFNRLRHMDWAGSSEVQEMGYPFARVSVLGVSYRFNPRVVVGERRISNGGGGDLREGPYTTYFAFSL